MGIKTFAAIDIGSYNVRMDIYEMSQRMGIRHLDTVQSRLEMGKETYSDRTISVDTAKELCKILKSFTEIMKEYQVDDYRVCATSTLREAENVWMVLGQVFPQTGLEVDILSNSEQRFYGYKSIAAKETSFAKIIQKGTAIIEIGGGNVQVSLFDKDALVTTQDFKMGSLRIRELLHPLESETLHYGQVVEELVHNQILGFKKLHLKDRKAEHIILLGNTFIEGMLEKNDSMRENRTVSFQAFMDAYKWIMSHSPEEISVKLGISLDYAESMIPALIIYRVFMEEFGAQTLWFPGTHLNDGISYDYAEKHKLIKSKHNFENDILVSARNIAKRYMSSKSHTAAVVKHALAIFDGMKKIHGMSGRQRLLMQIVILLHDCGNYISFSNSSECAYEIIMSTEIIGLSHQERELIANIVRYVKQPFHYDYGADFRNVASRSYYMTAAKLTAIIRVANALDRSHRQKIEEIKATVKEKELVMSVLAKEDMTLEKGLLKESCDFFEEVFSIRPVLKCKKQK